MSPIEIVKALEHRNRVLGNSESTIAKDRWYLTILLNLEAELFQLEKLDNLVIKIREHFKSPNSVRTALLVLKKTHKELWGNVLDLKIPSWRTFHTKADNVTPQEFIALVEAGNVEEKALLTILLFGLRRTELLNLKLKDLRFNRSGECEITIRESKTRSGRRTILIPNKFAFMVRDWVQFHPNRDKPEFQLWNFKRTTLYYMLKMLGAKAGIPVSKCHPHAFRHTIASYLIEHKVPLPHVNNYMGWSQDSNMWKTYFHMNNTDTHEAIRKLFS